MVRQERPIGIDLFCGAGGFSLGFEQAGFDVVAAIDSDPIHIAIHSENFPKCKTLCADLSHFTGEELRLQAGIDNIEIDVVFGGPPCGGFSLIGNRKFNDPRNELIIHFARLVGELRPRYFIVENVEGLLLDPMTKILKAFEEYTGQFGYTLVKPITALNAGDYGVPQRRKRIFILGYQSRLVPLEYPKPLFLNGSDGDKRRLTVWDAIGELPNIDDFAELQRSDTYRGKVKPTNSHYAKILRGEIIDPEDFSHDRNSDNEGLSGCSRTAHTAETVRRFKATQPGTYEPVSRFYRLTRDGLCPTLRAGTAKSHGSFSAPRPIHPIHPRCISVREGARLHSFPDWFRFHETKWHGFRQIGNSVPPLLARAVANVVRSKLIGSYIDT